MKFIATVDGHEYAVDVQPGAKPSTYVVKVADGQEREVDLAQTARGWLYSLLLDGKSYQVARGEGELQIDGLAFAVELERDVGLRRSEAGGAAAGPARLKAPIPGLVVAVNVAAGDHVEEGQALVIVEAMKMQMELKSPRAGTVAELNVQAGQEVAQGQLLAVIGE
ncbi:MAG TPA: biotin/lipoyl-containing protein [Chloroflexota bacterium]|nr:biotin/lipoyl-containing protein [Chloroflexota bacterium]